MEPIVITENFNPTIIRDEGFNVSVSVTAVGGVGDLTAQWYKDGVKITGATAFYLELTDSKPIQSGRYKVVVTDSKGNSKESKSVLISIKEKLKIIASNPKAGVFDTGVNAGTVIAMYNEVAGGKPPYTFIWYVNEKEVSRESNVTHTKGEKSYVTENSGDSSVFLQGKVQDSAGTVVSGPIYKIHRVYN